MKNLMGTLFFITAGPIHGVESKEIIVSLVDYAWLLTHKDLAQRSRLQTRYTGKKIRPPIQSCFRCDSSADDTTAVQREKDWV
jgi:hypothetical protein